MDNAAQTTKVKMSGYLHLKKKRMMTSWKNYWFVLENRLLLYYHSKAEYEAISPCKGSINLGPPCAVKSLPSVTNAFQIETRTVIYTLKAENSDEQKKWMQIILAALNQNQNFNPEGAKRLSHFRYSLDNLIPEVEPNDSQVLKNSPLERQNTMPHPLKREMSKESAEIIQRLQKIGAHSYGGSPEAISKIATKKVGSAAQQGHAAGAPQEEEGSKEEDIMRLHPRVIDNIYERISQDSQYSNRESFLVDNENYSIPLRKSVTGVEGEVLHQQRGILLPTRETKSLIVENDQYGECQRHAQSDEVIYAEPKINEVTDCNENSVMVENSFYASSRSSQSENLYEDLDKFHLYSQPVFKPEDISSQSSVEVRKSNENCRLKKSKSFIRRVWKRKKKNKKEPEEEEIYEEIDPNAVEKLSVTDGGALQMLSELQNILANKKTQMKATALNNPSNDQPESKKTNKSTTSSDSESICPSLPPKTHKISQSKQPIEQLDEILEDLDKEKQESKSKVQMLIEKFSEPEADVVLRKHDKSDFKEYRHSDELNNLLNELAKVTSAPIMTPGVTSSLVNPNLTDEEWMKLLPVRQRRLSEPDYDVPRPLQLPPQPDPDAILATRFFGPALPTLTDNKEDSLTSVPVSMTPDSLEVEQQEQKNDTHYSYTSHNYYNNHHMDLKCFAQNYNHQDEKVVYAMPKSYVSVATHIVNTCQNFCGSIMADENTIIYKSVKNVQDAQEEIFKDSLELCSETATKF